MFDSSNTANTVADTVRVQPLSDVQAILHPAKLYAHPVNDAWQVAGWIFLVGMTGYILWLFFRSPLCKDESFDPRDGKLRPVKERPFSYGRVQLCWWSLIIMCCYWYFFMTYGILLPLNYTAVLLLGGPVAVFVFGKVMDNNQIRDNNGEVPTRHQDTEPSKGLLTDILSDDNGISIHRLQAVFFNLIYGIGFLNYFFASVANHKYPFIQFEQWQLVLLGISAAGYLTMKSNENPDSTKAQRKMEAMAKRNVQ